MTISRIAAIALLSGALVLTGCAGNATPAAEATATSTASGPGMPTASDTATPTPTPTPSGTESEPAAAEFTLTMDGIDDLVIGEKVPSPSTVVEWDPEGCYGGRGRYRLFDEKETEIGAFTMVTDGYVEDGIVTQILSYSESVTTPEGIHVGSTRAELEAAYPDFAAVTKSDLTDLYVLENDKTQMVFEVLNPGSGDGYDPAKKDDTVGWITVEISSNKAHSLAATDAAGPCPG